MCKYIWPAGISISSSILARINWLMADCDWCHRKIVKNNNQDALGQPGANVSEEF